MQRPDTDNDLAGGGGSHPAVGDGQRLHVSAGPGQRMGARKNPPQPVPAPRQMVVSRAGEPVIEVSADRLFEGTPLSAALVPDEQGFQPVDLLGGLPPTHKR